MIKEQNKTPMMLHFLTKSNFAELYTSDEDYFSGSEYSHDQMMNILSDGSPLYYNAAIKAFPTSMWTAGHLTSTGKWVSGKNDKRAGK